MTSGTQRARIRPDIVAEGLASPVLDLQTGAQGWLPEGLLQEGFLSEQPDDKDNDEYNTVLTHVSSGKKFLINSIELELLGSKEDT